MCSAKEWMQSPPPPIARYNGQHKQLPSRKSKLRLHWLIIRRRYEGGMARTGKHMVMEVKNLKLYLENLSLLLDNYKLTQMALRLRQDNLALLSLFHHNFNLSSTG